MAIYNVPVMVGYVQLLLCHRELVFRNRSQSISNLNQAFIQTQIEGDSIRSAF